MSEQPNDDLGGVTIGARDIYDQLVAMRSDVQSLTTTNTTTAEKLSDHETRIRAVERWIWSAPAALLTGAATAVVVLLK